MFSMTLCGSEFARHLDIVSKDTDFIQGLIERSLMEDCVDTLSRKLISSGAKRVSQPLSDNIIQQYIIKFKNYSNVQSKSAEKQNSAVKSLGLGLVHSPIHDFNLNVL